MVPSANVRSPRLRIHPTGARHESDAYDFLMQEAGANAVLLAWLRVNGTAGVDPNGSHLIVASEGNEIRGMMLLAFRELACLSHGSHDVGRAFGRYLRDQGWKLQTLVGSRPVTDGVLEILNLGDRSIVLEQQVATLSSADSLPTERQPGLREARDTDIAALIESGHAMHLEEIGSPLSRRRDLAFRRGVAAKVEAGLTWVLRDPLSDELLFKASASAVAREVIMVEGIWVAPAARRRGIARACLGVVFRSLLERHAMISLTVACDNTPAWGLYEGLGFQRSLGRHAVIFDG